MRSLSPSHLPVKTVSISVESLTQIPISTPGPNLVRNEPVSTVDFGIGGDRIPFLGVSMNASVQNVQPSSSIQFWGIQVSREFFKPIKAGI